MVEKAQRVRAQVHEVRQAGRVERAGVDEHAVLRHEFQALREPLKRQGRLSRSAGPGEQSGAVPHAEASGVQRNQSTAARREQIDREIDQLVTQVIFKLQHSRRHRDYRRSVLRGHGDECGLVRDRAQRAPCGEQPSRPRLRSRVCGLAGSQYQSDPAPNLSASPTVGRKTGIGRLGDSEQRRAGALEFEARAEHAKLQAPGACTALPEGIQRNVRLSHAQRATDSPSRWRR